MRILRGLYILTTVSTEIFEILQNWNGNALCVRMRNMCNNVHSRHEQREWCRSGGLPIPTSRGVTVTVLAQPLAVSGTSGRDSSVSIVQSVRLFQLVRINVSMFLPYFLHSNQASTVHSKSVTACYSYRVQSKA